MQLSLDNVTRFRSLASNTSTIIVLLLGAWAIACTAWLCEDAYISFRVVDNLVNGFGMRWNVVERVQAFSNPLWVLLLTPAYALTSDIYHTTLAISATISLATLWIIARRCGDDQWIGSAAALGLVLSPTFIEFSTSGLENPLSHLLVALFCANYLRDDIRRSRQAFLLMLIASIAAVNRLDNLILLGVPIGIFAWKFRSLVILRAVTLGAVPLIAWELFSLVYYGFVLPNTAYAKLATDIARVALVAQGLTYLRMSAAFDPAALFMLTCAVLAGALINRALMALLLGIGAELVFVTWVGGDFMVGRFLSTSVVAATAIVASGLSRLQLQLRRRAGSAMLIGIGIAGIFTAPLTIASPPIVQGVAWPLPPHGIVDERKEYYWSTGLRSPYRSGAPDNPWAAMGRYLRHANTRTFEYGAIGFLGYHAGPKVHIIDHLALSDPILARLPAIHPWRIGHFRRELPTGYFESVESGVNRLADPDLARLYDAMLMVTQGPLFSAKRWSAIVSLNIGDAATWGRRSNSATRVACRNADWEKATACASD